MAKTKTQHDPVQIDARRADQQIVFTDEAEDRFVKSCQWVFEVARLGISREVWLHELHALIGYVRAWVDQNKNRIEACYAAPRDNQFAILVSPASDRYDFDLAKQLTALDVKLSEKFKACACDVLQIPKGSSKFPDSQGALVIYDAVSRTQREVVPQP